MYAMSNKKFKPLNIRQYDFEKYGSP